LNFGFHLDRLIDPMDLRKHATEIRRLRQCRCLDDLLQLANSDGWLTPGTRDPRLKLVRHNSGTYLVVLYDDGWTSRISMEPFPK
jgi:hypothetical protein